MLASVSRCNAASPVPIPHRPWRHVKVFASGFDAIRAQQFLQEIPPVPRYSRRRFDSSSTTRSGEDHGTPIGSRSRWGHRGYVRDALDGSFRTVLGAGNGPPSFLPRHIALLGGRSEPAPPNKPPVPPDANWCCTTGTLSGQRRANLGARLRLRSSRRMA